MPRLADIVSPNGLDLEGCYMKDGLYIAGLQGGMDVLYLARSEWV